MFAVRFFEIDEFAQFMCIYGLCYTERCVVRTKLQTNAYFAPTNDNDNVDDDVVDEDINWQCGVRSVMGDDNINNCIFYIFS